MTSVAVVLGNPGLALAIVAASHLTFKAAPLIAAYLIFRKLALVPFEQWIKRRKRPRRTSIPGGAARAADSATSRGDRGTASSRGGRFWRAG